MELIQLQYFTTLSFLSPYVHNDISISIVFLCILFCLYVAISATDSNWQFIQEQLLSLLCEFTWQTKRNREKNGSPKIHISYFEL